MKSWLSPGTVLAFLAARWSVTLITSRSPLFDWLRFLILVFVVTLVVWNVYMRLRLRWLYRFNRYARRMMKGDADGVIVELAARRAAGDHSFVTTMALAAHCWLGRGEPPGRSP
jgi:hypothetical protein